MIIIIVNNVKRLVYGHFKVLENALTHTGVFNTILIHSPLHSLICCCIHNIYSKYMDVSCLSMMSVIKCILYIYNIVKF